MTFSQIKICKDKTKVKTPKYSTPLYILTFDICTNISFAMNIYTQT